MKERSANFTFNIGASQYGISIDVDPDTPGRGSIGIYSLGAGTMGDIGTCLTLKEWENQSLTGQAIPGDIWQRNFHFCLR